MTRDRDGWTIDPSADEGWEFLPDDDPVEPTRAPEVAAIHEVHQLVTTQDQDWADLAALAERDPAHHIPDRDEADEAGEWPEPRRPDDHEPDLEELLERQHYAFSPPPDRAAPAAPASGRRVPAHTAAPPATVQVAFAGRVDDTEAAALLAAERRRLRGLRAAVGGGTGEAVRAAPGDAGDGDRDLAEASAETHEREVEGSILAEVDAELAEVDAAVARLAAGRYGTCERCHTPIAADRLRAVPATRWCVRHEVEAADGRA